MCSFYFGSVNIIIEIYQMKIHLFTFFNNGFFDGLNVVVWRARVAHLGCTPVRTTTTSSNKMLALPRSPLLGATLGEHAGRPW